MTSKIKQKKSQTLTTNFGKQDVLKDVARDGNFELEGSYSVVTDAGSIAVVDMGVAVRRA